MVMAGQHNVPALSLRGRRLVVPLFAALVN